MFRDYNSVVNKIEKNNNKIVEEHLSNVGTSRYWKRRELHDVLSKEKEILEQEIKYMFDYCNVLEMLHQHRYEFIEEEIIKMVKGE